MLRAFLEFGPRVTMMKINKVPCNNYEEDIQRGENVPHTKAEIENFLKHSENMRFGFAGVLHELPSTVGAGFWQTSSVRCQFQGFVIKGQETPEQPPGH